MLAKAPALAAAFEKDFAEQKALRAVTCAAGIERNFFESVESVRARVGNAQCFAEFDAELERRLRRRRLELLLAAEPLRPIPPAPARTITATNTITAVAFADTAGAALITTLQSSLEIIDLGTDSVIFRDAAPGPFEHSAALSPNGRVFSALHGNDGVRLRESATGEVLLDMPEFNEFKWLDSTTAWVTRRGQGKELLDLPTGKSALVRGIPAPPSQLLRLPGAAPATVAHSAGRLTQFAVRRTADGPQIDVQSEIVTPTRNWAQGATELTIDGGFLVQGGQSLAISNLSTRATEDIAVSPHRASLVSPLPDPAEVLVGITPAGGGHASQRYFVLDVESKSFAPVEDQRFTVSDNSYPPRTVYMRPLNRIGLISGVTVTLLDELPHGFRMRGQAFAEHLQEQAELLRPAAAAAPGAATGNIPALAANARVEAVGVYTSAAGAKGLPGRPSPRGAVTVRVIRSNQPIVLVLTAYDPVDWYLQVEPGAQLKAVLVGSYHPANVYGAGDAQVQQIGRSYAYDRNSGEFVALQRVVQQWTGKPIGTFQGRYEGTTFIVGGR